MADVRDFSKQCYGTSPDDPLHSNQLKATEVIGSYLSGLIGTGAKQIGMSAFNLRAAYLDANGKRVMEE